MENFQSGFQKYDTIRQENILHFHVKQEQEYIELYNYNKQYNKNAKDACIVPKLNFPDSDSNTNVGHGLTTGEDICNFKTQCSLKRQEFSDRKQRAFQVK